MHGDQAQDHAQPARQPLAPLTMALAVRGDGRWRPITVVSLAATVLFVTFLFLPWGNATFLMAVVTLFAWIAVIGVRLAPRIRFSTRAIVSKDPSPVLINSREPEESLAGPQMIQAETASCPKAAKELSSLTRRVGPHAMRRRRIRRR